MNFSLIQKMQNVPPEAPKAALVPPLPKPADSATAAVSPAAMPASTGVVGGGVNKKKKSKKKK